MKRLAFLLALGACTRAPGDERPPADAAVAVKQVMKAGPAPNHDPSGPGPPPSLLEVRGYRRGDATIALVLAAHPSGSQELTAIADGAMVGRRTGSFLFDSTAVIQDLSAAGRRYLHATATAMIEVAAFAYPSMSATAPAGPAARRLFAREQQRAAGALQLLGADRALVEEVSRLRSGTKQARLRAGPW